MVLEGRPRSPETDRMKMALLKTRPISRITATWEGFLTLFNWDKIGRIGIRIYGKASKYQVGC